MVGKIVLREVEKCTEYRKRNNNSENFRGDFAPLALLSCGPAYTQGRW